MSAASFLVSDLVLVKSQSKERGAATRVDVRALSGETGRPVAGRRSSSSAASGTPSASSASRPRRPTRQASPRCASTRNRIGRRRFIYGRKGEDLALDLDASYWTHPERPDKTTASLVFTDRSHLPAAAEDPLEGARLPGRSAGGPVRRLAARAAERDARRPEQPGRRDAHGDDQRLRHGGGRVRDPDGPRARSWRVATSLGGADARVRVEEYKRPTFEVTLKDPAEPLRLNRPARLTGEARYYFGLPVTAGNVRWRVTRTPQYPWWFWWRGWARPAQTETIAAGTSALGADGTFALALHAGGRRAARRRTTRDDVHLHGRRRRDRRGRRDAIGLAVFRLGFVAVEARVDLPGGFLRAGKKCRDHGRAHEPRRRAARGPRILAARRARAAGAAAASRRAAAGSVRRSPGPKAACGRRATRCVRAGTRTYDPSQASCASWADGAESRAATSRTTRRGGAHRAAGLPPAPTACATRRGTSSARRSTMPREFVVAGETTPLAPAGRAARRARPVPVGQTARLLAASGLPGQPLVLEIYRDGRPSSGAT